MTKVEVKFGTIIDTIDGQCRVIIRVKEKGKYTGIETLGIVSLDPLHITYGNGSGNLDYILKVYEKVLSVSEIFEGVVAYNGSWISAAYLGELEDLSKSSAQVLYDLNVPSK